METVLNVVNWKSKQISEVIQVAQSIARSQLKQVIKSSYHKRNVVSNWDSETSSSTQYWLERPPVTVIGTSLSPVLLRYWSWVHLLPLILESMYLHFFFLILGTLSHAPVTSNDPKSITSTPDLNCFRIDLLLLHFTGRSTLRWQTISWTSIHIKSFRSKLIQLLMR